MNYSTINVIEIRKYLNQTSTTNFDIGMLFYVAKKGKRKDFKTNELARFLMDEAKTLLEGEKDLKYVDRYIHALLQVSVIIVKDVESNREGIKNLDEDKKEKLIASHDYNKEDIEKILLLRVLYEKLLDKTKTERVTTIDSNLNMFDEMIERFYKDFLFPEEEETVEEQTEEVDYNAQLAELNSTIEALKKEKEKLAKELETSEKSNDKKKEKIAKLDEEVKSKNLEIKTLKTNLTAEKSRANKVGKEKEKKEKELEEALSKVSSLQDEIKKIREELATISTKYSDVKREYETKEYNFQSLTQQLEDARKEIETLKNKEIFLTNKEQRDKNVEDRKVAVQKELIRILFDEELTINEIVKRLEEYNVSVQDVENYLIDLKGKINIDGKTYSSDGVIYKILPELARSSDSFNITVENGKKCIDLLLTSDFHLTNSSALGSTEGFDDGILRDFDRLYEYATQHDIKFIFNLGDFFSGRYYGTVYKYYGYQDARNLIDNTVKYLPKNTGIYHAILGGNHDKDILNYGIDPIGELSRRRNDIIDLGYDHAEIDINGVKSQDTSFMLHHPSYSRFGTEADYKGAKELAMLKEYYSSIGKPFDSTYADFDGGSHICSINGGIIQVPSYFKDRQCNGAFNLKIYLTDDGKIDEMVLTQLIKDDTLKPVSEFLLQKKNNR